MRIQFSPYVLIYTDNVDVYDVYQIVIDEEEKLTGESKTIIEKGNIVYGVDKNDDSV